MAQPQGTQRMSPLSNAPNLFLTKAPPERPLRCNIACTFCQVWASTSAACSPGWISDLYLILPTYTTLVSSLYRLVLVNGVPPSSRPLRVVQRLLTQQRRSSSCTTGSNASCSK